MTRRRTSSRLRAVALLALPLVAAACGARWTDEQAATVTGRGTVTDGAAAPVAGRSPVTTTPGGSTAGPTGSGDVGASPGSGGESSVPGAAPGSGGGSPGPVAEGGGGPLPCAAPSDAPGVSDDEIVIGTINSLSGPVPGLAASAAGAIRAQVAYRNSVGGVCGRRIVLQEGDDGTDNGRYRTVFSDMENKVFAIAGGFALGDVGATELIQASGIPVVNSPGAQRLADLPNVIDMVPNAQRSARYEYMRQNGGTKASLTYLAVDQSRFEANLQRSLMEKAGIEIVQVQELPLSTLSYDSAARSAANSGASYLFFIGDANTNIKMARAVADTGHRFAFFELFTFAYGSPSFLGGAGSAAEGIVTWLRVLPNEDRSNEQVARYNDWMERIAPGEPRDTFASDSWAGGDVFFENLEALPGPITRESFLAQIRGVETYDAGGFIGPIRLGAEVAEGCTVGMQVKGGTWTRLVPAQGFLC